MNEPDIKELDEVTYKLRKKGFRIKSKISNIKKSTKINRDLQKKVLNGDFKKEKYFQDFKKEIGKVA